MVKRVNEQNGYKIGDRDKEIRLVLFYCGAKVLPGPCMLSH